MARTGNVRISARTLWNWILDATVLISGIITAISGVYFLFLATGYQGGRNPYYGIVILFTRETWTLIHTWSGVLMTVALLFHLAIHTGWIGMMFRRLRSAVSGGGSRLSAGARTNVLVDIAVALSFVVCAASGVYFLYVPSGGLHGAAASAWGSGFVFSRITWDLIHTWSGVSLILAALAHVAIHWLWITKVTSKVGRAASGSFVPRRVGLKTTGDVRNTA